MIDGRESDLKFLMLLMLVCDVVFLIVVYLGKPDMGKVLYYLGLLALLHVVVIGKYISVKREDG